MITVPKVNKLYMVFTLLIYFISLDLAELAAGPWTSALSLPARSIRFKAAIATSDFPLVFLDSTITRKLINNYILCDLELL
jgi:hypothetical protein